MLSEKKKMTGLGWGGLGGDRWWFRAAQRSDAASPTASTELRLGFRGLQKSFCMSLKKLPSEMFSVRHSTSGNQTAFN